MQPTGIDHRPIRWIRPIREDDIPLGVCCCLSLLIRLSMVMFMHLCGSLWLVCCGVMLACSHHCVICAAGFIGSAFASGGIPWCSGGLIVGGDLGHWSVPVNQGHLGHGGCVCRARKLHSSSGSRCRCCRARRSMFSFMVDCRVSGGMSLSQSIQFQMFGCPFNIRWMVILFRANSPSSVPTASSCVVSSLEWPHHAVHSTGVLGRRLPIGWKRASLTLWYLIMWIPARCPGVLGSRIPSLACVGAGLELRTGGGLLR